MIPYVGNGAYCYANSLAMALAARGLHVGAGKIEVLTGVGLGAMWLPDAEQLFFSGYANSPDRGVDQALELLNVRFSAHYLPETGAPPLNELRAALANGPVVLGPLDMGTLTYNPDFEMLHGVDHFVLGYALDDTELRLHDPDTFPHVSLTIEDFVLAWRADSIAYRRGNYSFWSNMAWEQLPDAETQYNRAIAAFKRNYPLSREIAGVHVKHDGDAIRHCAELARQNAIGENLRGHLVYFALKLGARRALDFAGFFAERTPHLAEIKQHQALVFGAAHVAAVHRNWPSFANALDELATIEDTFRGALLESE